MKINAETQAIAQSLAEQIGRMSDSEAEGPEANAICRRLNGLVGEARAEELIEAASNAAGLSAAARALRAIPSASRSEQSRSNGRRGGRPVVLGTIAVEGGRATVRYAPGRGRVECVLPDGTVEVPEEALLTDS